MLQEENGPVPQQEEFGSGQPKLTDEYRPSDESLIRQQLKLMRSHFEGQQKILDKCMDDVMRYFDQHTENLEQDARQPRLAMEAEGTQIRRLASARRVPPLQFKRCMGIAVLHKRFKLDRRPRSVSA